MQISWVLEISTVFLKETDFNLIDPLRVQVIPRMLISVQALINPFIYAFNQAYAIS